MIVTAAGIAMILATHRRAPNHAASAGSAAACMCGWKGDLRTGSLAAILDGLSDDFDAHVAQKIVGEPVAAAADGLMIAVQIRVPDSIIPGGGVLTDCAWVAAEEWRRSRAALPGTTMPVDVAVEATGASVCAKLAEAAGRRAAPATENEGGS